MLHKIHPDVLDIIAQLQNAHFETYIVGGAVRDILLNRIPKDYDVCTAATPEEVVEVFGRKQSIIIGKRFRIVHVKTPKHTIEVSTFRRKPNETKMLADDNEYGTASEDAFRRDFTVNAIFYNPIKDELIDLTKQGLSDLEKGVVRVIGDPCARFDEDPVRVLRALKLVGQYNFKMEPETADALIYAMRLLLKVSPSRLALEVEKILRSPYGFEMLTTFKKHGLLKFFMPWLDQQWGTPECQYALELFKVYNQRIKKGAFTDSASLAIAALILPFIEKKYGLGKGMLWEKNHDIKYQIKDVLEAFLYPHGFCGRILDSTLNMLLLQTDFLRFDGDMNRLTQSRSYVRGRELFILQNEIISHISNIEEHFPGPSESFFKRKAEGGHLPPPHHKKRRRKRFQNPNKPICPPTE